MINDCTHDWEEPFDPVIGDTRACLDCGAVEELMLSEDLGFDGPYWERISYPPQEVEGMTQLRIVAWMAAFGLPLPR